MPLIRYTFLELIDIVELFNYFTHCVISKHYLFSHTVHENVFTKEHAIIKKRFFIQLLQSTDQLKIPIQTKKKTNTTHYLFNKT